MQGKELLPSSFPDFLLYAVSLAYWERKMVYDYHGCQR